MRALGIKEHVTNKPHMLKQNVAITGIKNGGRAYGDLQGKEATG